MDWHRWPRLVVFDPTTQEFRNYPADMLPLRVTSLGMAGDTVLVGSDNGAFVIMRQGTPLDFDDDRVVQFQTPRILSNTVMSVGATAEGFWVGTNRGADRLARTLDSVVSFPRPLGDTVKSIIEYHSAAHLATEWGESSGSTGPGLTRLWSTKAPVQCNGWRIFAIRYTSLRTAASADSREAAWKTSGAATCGRSLRAATSGSDSADWLEAGNGLGRLQPDGGRHVHAARQLASNNIAVAMTDSGGEIYACHYLTQWGFKSISHRRADGVWEWLQDTILNARSMGRTAGIGSGSVTSRATAG